MLFSSETSNLSGLKAAKPTTFAKPNANPKLNPNPKHHVWFKSSENSNPKGNVVHKDKALQCFFLSFISRPHFLPVFLGNEVQTSKKKLRTNVLQPKTSLYTKIQQFLSTFFFSKIVSYALFPPGPSIVKGKISFKVM